MNVQKLVSTWWTLRVTYGLLFVVAGLDKFTNLVTMWEKYLSPMVIEYLPLEIAKIMMGIAGIEILIGAVILLGCARLGGYLAMFWLLIISLNLLSTGMYFDIAVRDIVMAVGALTLARLTSLKNEAVKGI